MPNDIHEPIFYVAKDPERAMGLEMILKNYHVICPYESPLTAKFRDLGTPVYVLEEKSGEGWEKYLRAGTYGILAMTDVQAYIRNRAKNKTPHILVLKVSRLIEKIAQKHGWKLLAPKAALAEKYERKISQYRLLKNLVAFPPTYLGSLQQLQKSLSASIFPAVMQFNIGHSGNTTFLLKSLKDLDPHVQQHPKRDVRISPHIKGETYTLNALVTKKGDVYTGSISLQLTGLPEATGNPATTVGNDFGEAARNLSAQQARHIAAYAQTLGAFMHKEGYRGLFGIDVIVESESAKVYFIEVNTHQPASIPFETKLHMLLWKMPLMHIFIHDMMEENLHIATEKRPPLLLPFAARQVVYRNKEKKNVPAITIRMPKGTSGILTRMEEVAPNEELFRIQHIANPIEKI